MYDYETKETEHQQKREMQRKIYRNRINKEYKRKKRICWMIFGISALVLLVMFGISLLLKEMSLMFITIIVFVGIAIVQIVALLNASFCPHCGKFTGYMVGVSYCPYCGAMLEYSKDLDSIDTAEYADTDEE